MAENQLWTLTLFLTCVFLNQQKSVNPPDSSGTMPLVIVYLGSMTVGTAFAIFLRPHEHRYTVIQADDLASPRTGNREFVKKMFALLYEEKMLLLILVLIYTGLQQAFIWYVCSLCRTLVCVRSVSIKEATYCARVTERH